MKKIIAVILTISLCLSVCLSMAACNSQKTDYTVGICQAMRHPSLDEATQGFKDALNEKLNAAGKTVCYEEDVPAESSMCSTIINSLVAKNVDLIMANATPALIAASATTTIPVLGTSVTDYNDTFKNNIPGNISGTSDAVPFDEQAQMMIETLGLVAGDQVGVLYCTNESNSVFQYEAVKEYFEDKDIVVKAYTFSDNTQLQATANTMASQCKAVYIPSDNTVAANDELVGVACNAAKVPVYTSYGGTICYASLAIDYYQLGYETGLMAAQILLGEKTVDQIEIKTLTPEITFNEELCAELGIAVPDENK